MRARTCVVAVMSAAAAFAAAPPPRFVIPESLQQHRRTRCVPPVYPQQARDARVEGTVRLRVLVDGTGKVSSVTPLAGHRLLTGAAAEAVRGWRYRPLAYRGRPAIVQTEVNVVFRLSPDGDPLPFPCELPPPPR